jgi:hypothetical protein
MEPNIMNRRDFLITSGAAAAIVASPLPAAMLKPSRVIFHGRAAANRHAPLVSKWAAKLIADGHVYTRDDFMGSKVKLTDPLFRVFPAPASFKGSKVMVWNWMTGYTDEPGLEIFVIERGIPLFATGIGTSIGYEEYFGHERDVERYPDYFVRSPVLTYNDRALLEPKLPKDHITMDDRWFEQMMKTKEQASA